MGLRASLDPLDYIIIFLASRQSEDGFLNLPKCSIINILKIDNTHFSDWNTSCLQKRRNTIIINYFTKYKGADKSLARPTSRCILFDGENISFDASLVIYIYIYIYIELVFLQL